MAKYSYIPRQKPRKMSEGTYGVRVIGVSGISTMWFRSRADAERVRKAISAYKKQGGWTGGRTMDAFVDYAVRQKGVHATTIASNFIARR